MTLRDSTRTPRTVFITGTSTGIGQSAVPLFLDAGWQVAATVRTIHADLPTHSNLRFYRVDVTDRASIEAAIAQTVADFGNLDVLVNNAGYGLAGPFETASQEQIDRLVATNLYGVMHGMRAAIPHFRSQGHGCIINVTSVGGRLTLPFNSIYHATKFAVEGLTEGLYFELAPQGIQVKIVEPGGVATDFAGRSMDWTAPFDAPIYGVMMQRAMAAMLANSAGSYAQPAEIANVILEAATDGTDQLRYVAGANGQQLMDLYAESTQAEWYATMQQQWGLADTAQGSNSA